MKKTFSVNLGGSVFNIDEDAYSELMGYLHDVKRHLGNDASSDEVLNDIEQRISELFNDWMQNKREVVTSADVQRVIDILGRPEQFDSAEKEENGQSGPGFKNEDSGRNQRSEYANGARRRLYRDTENAVLGGVCSGLAAYLNVGVVLIRVVIFFLIWFGGSGLLIYILCWIIIPEARTAAQRLEMKGEDVTIDNIEKKVREEYGKVKDRFGNYVETNNIDERASSFGHRIGNFFVICFKVFFGFIAGIIGISGFMALLALLFALIVLWAGGPFVADQWLNLPYPLHGLATGTVSLITLGLILTIGIPFIAIFNLLFGRLLNLKPAPRWLTLTGFIIWLIGVGMVIYSGINFIGLNGYNWI